MVQLNKRRGRPYQRCWSDFLGGPVVTNLPCNAGDAGSIPGQETRILHASEQLSPCAATTESTSSGGHNPQQKTPHNPITPLTSDTDK